MLSSDQAVINRPLRVIFAGTPEFALQPLQALLDEGCEVVAVLTQPDRPAGRGKKLSASPVKQLALANQLPVLQPPTLRNADIQAQLKSLQADLMVVVAYGLMIPAEVLDMPRLGCWNIHASLLPRWRGAAPVQRAIEAGDTSSGVCIMQMEPSLDSGPVYYRMTTDIKPGETGGSLHDRLAEMGAAALRHCLQAARKGQLADPEPQKHDHAVYAHKLTKAEAELDWQLAADVLERQVRAFNPWPVSWCELEGQRLRIWHAEVANCEKPLLPGETHGTPDALYIGTFDKALKVLEVQRAGGQRMPIAEFMKAHPTGVKNT